MKIFLAGVLSVGLIGALGVRETFTRPAAAAPRAAETRGVAAARIETDTVRLRVEGMTCGGCAISARIVLERLEGVRSATVDYDTRTATVQYDGTRISPEQMIAALRDDLKYTATVVTPEP
jgi:copper chaperone CopZ